MLGTYLLAALVLSIFLYCCVSLITVYFPFKNLKTHCIVNSLFNTIIVFSMLSYILFFGNLTFQTHTIFLISGIVSIIYGFMIYKEKTKKMLEEKTIENSQLTINQTDMKSIEDFFGETGEIFHILSPEGPLNTYLGKLNNDQIVYLYSLDKMEINDIFVITKYEEGKIYCELKK